MKRRVLLVFIALIASLCGLLLFACDTPKDKSVEFTVVIVDGEGFSVENNGVRVKRGENAVLKILLDDRRDIFSVDCDDYTLEYLDMTDSDAASWHVNMTVNNVRRNMRISITTGNPFDKDEIRIDYFLMGGTLANGGIVKRVYPDLTYHLRANTDIGTDIKRDGYTLIGWNTRPSGKGTHIGLGSRVTVSKATRLFAEWVEHTDEQLFTYEIEGGKATVTDYLGDKEVNTICVPETLGGATVTEIARESLSGIKVDRLVLPRTVTDIEARAFSYAEVENFYFFDSLNNIYNSAFDDGQMRYMHINAARPPAYFTESENSFFAEKLDNLILNRDKKKIVFFSGCSMMYGLNCEQMRNNSNFDEYELIDVSVLGGLSANFQMEIISKFLNSGDILLHAPEQYSPYSMMSEFSVDSRVFIMVECNYDLLSYVDFTKQPQLFFDGYIGYNKARNGIEPVTYAHVGQTYKLNSYGNYSVERRGSENDNKNDDGVTEDFDIDILTVNGFAQLNAFYQDLAARGVKVLYSYAPLNINGMSPNCDAAYRRAFHRRLLELIDQESCTVISIPENYVYYGHLFYDTNYHLTNEGAEVRTKTLIQDMLDYL